MIGSAKIIFSIGTSLRSRFLPPLYCFDFIFGNAFAFCVHKAEVHLCNIIALFGSLASPFDSLRIILLYSPAILIGRAEHRFRTLVALYSCLLQPFYGFRIVFWYTMTKYIGKTKAGFRIGISLSCGFLPPFYCFCVIFRHALALMVSITKYKLCRSITIFGSYTI